MTRYKVIKKTFGFELKNHNYSKCLKQIPVFHHLVNIKFFTFVKPSYLSTGFPSNIRSLFLVLVALEKRLLLLIIRLLNFFGYLMLFIKQQEKLNKRIRKMCSQN